MPALSLRFIRAAVGVFYRHEHVGGNVPDIGPIILVANHPNGMVDPIALSWTTPRSLRFLGKAPLLTMPLLGFFVRRAGTLPVYRAQDGANTADNDKTFSAVFDALADGDAVCLFPEGISHNEPGLQKLKTGAARMALGAEARASFALGVRIVPVGLVYRAKHHFRSPVATWIGEPIPVDDLAELHAQDAWGAVEALTARIAAGLKRVMLELDDWEDLPLVRLAERIDSDGSTVRPAAERLQRLRAYAVSLRQLRRQRPEYMQELTLRVAAFAQRLQDLNINVRDLDANYTLGAVFGFVLRNLFWLLIGFPFAVVGYALFFVPYWMARIVGHRVKTSMDIYATVQILSGIVFYCLWSFVLVIAAFWFLQWKWGLILLAMLLPAGVAALALHDWRRRVLADIGTFFRLGAKTQLQRSLLEEKDALARELEELRQELGANPTAPS